MAAVETLQRENHGRFGKTKRRRSFPKIHPLPGGLYAERKRCNRPNCRCVVGNAALHGPYLCRRWMENGHLRRQYVRPADEESVRAGIAEWRRRHPPTRSERDALAALRRLTDRFHERRYTDDAAE